MGKVKKSECVLRVNKLEKEDIEREEEEEREREREREQT